MVVAIQMLLDNTAGVDIEPFQLDSSSDGCLDADEESPIRRRSERRRA